MSDEYVITEPVSRSFWSQCGMTGSQLGLDTDVQIQPRDTADKGLVTVGKSIA